MSGRVILIRHAESQHNVDKNLQQQDPGLTAKGTEAAAHLGLKFPYSNTVGVVLSSPLRRAIQTALAAFPHVLDKRYFDSSSGQGVETGATLVIDAAAQERSDLPCDTGSERTKLEEVFPQLDFSPLSENWHVKNGPFSADDDAVAVRAAKLRQTLSELVKSLPGIEKQDVVVVTHGVFMKVLTGDESVDLPRPGWAAYHVKEDANGHLVLVPTNS